MIALFTDFGLAGPYTGQMKAVLAREAPDVPVIDLFADAPAARPDLAAYLLAAYAAWFPAGTVFLAVVDPGVGGARAALALEADGKWFVGPDNGLFALVRRRATTARAVRLAGDGRALSASFHGRDLFAPAAARIARGEGAGGVDDPGDAIDRPEWPDALARIVYIDHYGNAMTGLMAGDLAADAVFARGGAEIHRARTFSDVAPGQAFWYENANGLIEIAVNQGRADRVLGLSVGDAIGF